MYRASKTACAAEFIEQSGQGYDTLLGQGGVNLSGGQKQRLSTVMRTDRILCMDNGAVQGFGTHEELMAQNGIYAGMYRIQTAFGE